MPIGQNAEDMSQIKREIGKYLEVKDIGALGVFLGTILKDALQVLGYRIRTTCLRATSTRALWHVLWQTGFKSNE